MAYVLSGQIDCSLRLSGDNSQLSSSVIWLSERLLWASFYCTLALPSLQPRQLGGSVVLPILNVVPNKLICYPCGLFLSQFNVLKSGVMAYGKPLAAFAADNGFHEGCSRGNLREPP